MNSRSIISTFVIFICIESMGVFARGLDLILMAKDEPCLLAQCGIARSRLPYRHFLANPWQQYTSMSLGEGRYTWVGSCVDIPSVPSCTSMQIQITGVLVVLWEFILLLTTFKTKLISKLYF